MMPMGRDSLQQKSGSIAGVRYREAVLSSLVEEARIMSLISDGHSSVEGTLIEA